MPARPSRDLAPAHSIAHYLSTDVPTAAPTEQVDALRRSLQGRGFDDAENVFVVEPGGRFAGVLPLGVLLGARGDADIASLVLRDWPVVAPEMSREDAASIAIRHDVPALAVCGEGGRFLGAVPARALIAILRDEHLEDLHHMAGILAQSGAAQAALSGSPWRRALYRLPWLLVGVVGAGIATALMARFESALAEKIAIAFFVPAIVYLADAVGTQSEAVAVRGLSLTDRGIAGVLGSEIVTGVLIGAALAAGAFPLVWFAFGSVPLAATVAAALFAAASVATGLGFLLPWVFAQLGYDPALGSGPVATVIQDVLSIAIYFAIASAILL
jgi:magnesium transporter